MQIPKLPDTVPPPVTVRLPSPEMVRPDKLGGAIGKNAIACSAPTATGAGDGVGAHQIYVEVAVPVVPDGGAPQRALGDGRVVEGQRLAVPLDVVIICGSILCRNGAAVVRGGIGGMPAVPVSPTPPT